MHLRDHFKNMFFELICPILMFNFRVCFLHPSVNYDVSTAKNLLLLALSQEDQQKWVSRLMKKIPKKPPAPDAPHRSSPRVPAKVQSSQSMRRPSRQIPSGKPRLGVSLEVHIFMQSFGNYVAVFCSILCFHVANVEFMLCQCLSTLLSKRST